MSCKKCGDECVCGRAVWQSPAAYMLDDWMVDARNEEEVEDDLP